MGKCYDIPRIIISVNSGVVEVGDVPDGVIVEVRDFDVEECSEHGLPKDECEECFKRIEGTFRSSDGDEYTYSNYCSWYEIEGKEAPEPLTDLPKRGEE